MEADMRLVPRYDSNHACLWCGHHIQGVPFWDKNRAFCNASHRNLFLSGQHYHYARWGWWMGAIILILWLVIIAAGKAWSAERWHGDVPICSKLSDAKLMLNASEEGNTDAIAEILHSRRCLVIFNAHGWKTKVIAQTEHYELWKVQSLDLKHHDYAVADRPGLPI